MTETASLGASRLPSEKDGLASTLLSSVGNGNLEAEPSPGLVSPPKKEPSTQCLLSAAPPFDSSASFWEGASLHAVARSASGFLDPSQSFLAPSALPSQSLLLVPSPPPSQSLVPPSLGGAPAQPPRGPTPAEVGKGIFLCDRVLLEYSGDSQLPSEVRLAFKHPHGYRLKGPQKAQRQGAPGAPSTQGNASGFKRQCKDSKNHPPDSHGQGGPGPPMPSCKCSECGRCRAVAEAHNILSPFGISLQLCSPCDFNASLREVSLHLGTHGKSSSAARKKPEEQQAQSLALARCPPTNSGLASTHKEGVRDSGAAAGCVCAALGFAKWQSPERDLNGMAPPEGNPGRGHPGALVGHLYWSGLTLKEAAAVEAAAAVQRALSYFLLEAAPPAAAAAAALAVGTRVPGQKEKENALMQTGNGAPLAALKLLPERKQQQDYNRVEGACRINSAAGPPSTTTAGSTATSSSSSGGNLGLGPPRAGVAYDSQGTLYWGLLDAIVQLHDIPSEHRQAAVSSNHFAAVLSHQRAAVTFASKAFL